MKIDKTRKFTKMNVNRGVADRNTKTRKFARMNVD